MRPQGADREELVSRLAKLAPMLARPEYMPVDQEWERMRMKNPKKKAPPAWHSLFGGPVSVRQLAEHVKMAATK